MKFLKIRKRPCAQTVLRFIDQAQQPVGGAVQSSCQAIQGITGDVVLAGFLADNVLLRHTHTVR